MPNPDRRQRSNPAEAPTDELVLAAIERAALHRASSTPAVPIWAILEHLALARRSAAARHVRTRVSDLHQRGLIEHSRHHGIETWGLTDDGHRHLQRARRRGGLPALPESPQHRAWRNARTTAGHEIERFRTSVHARLAEAALLLDADSPPHSDDWLELADTLQRACRRLGSASYCLYEWREPDDAHADIDNGVDPGDDALGHSEGVRVRALRAGRRNLALWDNTHGGRQ